MASEGPNSPGTLANVAGPNTDWSNPTNAASSNDVRATAGSLGTSDDLSATNFSFSIPAGATIDGIEVAIEKQQIGGAGIIEDNAVRIIKGGTIQTAQNKAIVGPWSEGADETSTYGGSSDLWGVTWGVSDINASDFGVAVSAIETDGPSSGAGIDHITITVYYTAAAAASSYNGGSDVPLLSFFEEF